MGSVVDFFGGGCLYLTSCLRTYPTVEMLTYCWLQCQASVISQYKQLVQSSSIFQNSLRTFSKCWACSLPTYLIPKSSTTRVNHTGLVLCQNSPRVCGTSKQSFCSRRSLSNLLANMPACGSPYIPRCISMLTYPFLTVDPKSYRSMYSWRI